MILPHFLMLGLMKLIGLNAGELLEFPGSFVRLGGAELGAGGWGGYDS